MAASRVIVFIVNGFCMRYFGIGLLGTANWTALRLVLNTAATGVVVSVAGRAERLVGRMTP